MSDFAASLEAFRQKVGGRFSDLHLNVTLRMKSSIQVGDPLTGAPGQPVAPEFGGNLLNSWQDTYPEPLLSEVTTNVEYAEAVEEGQQEPYTTASGKQVTPRPMQFRSAVGGAHSLKLTRAGYDAVVEDELRKLVGSE